MPEKPILSEQLLNRLKEKTRILCRNIKGKPLRLIEIVTDLPSDVSTELIPVITDAFSINPDAVKVLNLASDMEVETARQALGDMQSAELLVLRYPNFNQAGTNNAFVNNTLNLYFDIQSWYFHLARKKPSPQVIVQVYDRSLETALNQSGAVDTLLKASNTPRIDIDF